MPTNSPYIVFPGPRQVAVLEETVAQPGPGQLLTETQVSLVSTGTESFCLRGEFDANIGWSKWVQYPFRPGYSNVGKVIAIGEGVSGFELGDLVWSSSSHRKHALIDAKGDFTLKLPPGTRPEDASWIALSYITQTGVRHANHRLGDAAVLVGMGPLGQLVTQYLRASGLREVIAVDTIASRVELAKKHGATAGFVGTAADAKAFLLDLLGELPDVAYDITGHWAVFPQVLTLPKNHGTVILLGDSPTPSKQVLTADIVTRQLKVQGTHNAQVAPEHAEWTNKKQALLFLKYVARGQMKVDDLVTHRFQPSQAPQLYDMLVKDRGQTGGVMIDWR